MKIGIDARMVFYTGIGRHVLNLLARLPRLAAQDEFVYFVRAQDRDKLAAELTEGDNALANVKLTPTISEIYNLAEQIKHLEIINKENLDLLHVPHFNVPIRYSGRLVVTVHDLIQAHFPSQDNLWAQIKKFGYNYVILRAMQKAQKIIAVSEYTRQDIIDTFGVQEEKIQVVYNGIDEKWGKDKLPPKRSGEVLDRLGLAKPFFLYVGLSSPHKNLLRLIEAMAGVREELTKQGKEIRLAIVGKKDERYLPDMRAAIQKHKLESNIIITDFVTDEDLAVLYRSALAFVFPSLYEGFGLPPLEAMQAGLPVLSSNATCLPEVLGESVVYFDPRDVSEMTRKMLEFAQSKKLPAAVPPRKYSWDEMAQETRDVYLHVLKQNEDVK